MKHAELAQHLLGDDPSATIIGLETAISDGADFADLGRSLSYAAQVLVGRTPINSPMRWVTFTPVPVKDNDCRFLRTDRASPKQAA